MVRPLPSRRLLRVALLTPPADVVEIQFTKPSFRYKAGQWLFLQVPSISQYQWHPFTITSCPYDPYVSVHVRQVGDFTRALGDAVGAGAAQAKLYEGVDPLGMYEVALQNGQQMPALRIDGPYGAPAEDVFNNEIAVLIGTGIGVTPWAAILKNIWHLRNGPNPPTRLRRVEFLWICKDTNSFEWFQTLLSSLEQQSSEAARIPGSNGIEFLKIHTYLTQKLDMDTTQNIVLNSVGADYDPLTELKARTNFGRPNFKKLFAIMRDGILDRTYLNGLEGSMQTTVGVYFCGPSSAGWFPSPSVANVSMLTARPSPRYQERCQVGVRPGSAFPLLEGTFLKCIYCPLPHLPYTFRAGKENLWEPPPGIKRGGEGGRGSKGQRRAGLGHTCRPTETPAPGQRFEPWQRYGDEGFREKPALGDGDGTVVERPPPCIKESGHAFHLSSHHLPCLPHGEAACHERGKGEQQRGTLDTSCSSLTP